MMRNAILAYQMGYIHRNCSNHTNDLNVSHGFGCMEMGIEECCDYESDHQFSLQPLQLRSWQISPDSQYRTSTYSTKR